MLHRMSRPMQRIFTIYTAAGTLPQVDSEKRLSRTIGGQSETQPSRRFSSSPIPVSTIDYVLGEHPEYFETLAGVRETVLPVFPGLADNDDWRGLEPVMAKSPTLMRYIRWLIAADKLQPCSETEFVAACESFVEAAQNGSYLLPAAATAVVKQSGRIAAKSVWNFQSPAVKVECQFADERHENHRQVHQVVQDIANSLNDAKSLLGIPLRRLQEIVHQPCAPAMAEEAAVWQEFQWTRTLFSALNGGRSTYRAWLQVMTDVDNDDSNVGVWNTFDADFHSLLPRALPGEFSGSVLQRLSDEGVWADTDARELARNTGMAGVMRVLAEYTPSGGGQPVRRFVSLLVNVPATKPPVSIGSEKDPLDRHELRTIINGRQQSVEIDGQRVLYLPTALTMPRLHFLERMAECFEKPLRGLKMTGVHGAGKSSLLQAVVGILAVGGEVDVMYTHDASLLREPSAMNVLSTALHGSGSLARQLWDGWVPRQGVGRFWGTWYLAANRGWKEDSIELGREVLRNMEGKAVAETRNVVIFDEVNKLIKAVDLFDPAKEASGAERFWHQWLPWRGYGQAGCFRILAASPHGEREEETDTSWRSTSMFELRAAPADHLAAVLLCAPKYLGQHQDTPAHLDSGAGLSAGQCLSVCSELGGNARFIASVLNNAGHGGLTAGTVDTAVAEAQERMVSRLHHRFVRSLQDAGGNEARCAKSLQTEIDDSVLMSRVDTARADASLLVRARADDSEPVLPAGLPAMKVIVKAAAEATMRNEHHTTTISAPKSGEQFERYVLMCAAMGVYARRMHLLREVVPGYSPQVGETRDGSLRRHETNGHGVLSWPQSSKEAYQHSIVSRLPLLMNAESTSSGTDACSTLEGAAVLPVRRLLFNDAHKNDAFKEQRQDRLVFSTAGNFPGVDIVVLQRQGTSVQATFVKTARSSLHREADSHQPVLSMAFASDGSSQPVYAKVAGALRDVFATAAVGKMGVTKDSARCVRLVDQSSKKKGKPEPVTNTHIVTRAYAGRQDASSIRANDLQAGTSVLNALLATLGVPYVVLPRLHTKDSDAILKDPNNGVPNVDCELSLRLEPSTVLCDALHGSGEWEQPLVKDWSVRMVYVSKQSMSANACDDFGTLDADFVYGIFAEDLFWRPSGVF